jgi:hypothetical protein
MTRPIPMLGDLALDFVTAVETRLAQRVAALPIVGLEGDAQQRLGRASHEIELHGLIVGIDARAKLGELQGKAAAGEELDFSADIATSLDLTKMVLIEASFAEHAGLPDRYAYRLVLRESPPLPPPAEASSFGGLDGFDLGFDPGALSGVLDSVLDQASALQEAISAVTSAVDQLQALAGLADLAFGNPLTPLQDQAASLSSVADPSAGQALGRALGG